MENLIRVADAVSAPFLLLPQLSWCQQAKTAYLSFNLIDTLSVILYLMISETESQGNEEGNYLVELLERARNRHGCNSWEEFAALITMRSGDQVSGNTFRRNLRKGVNASKSLSLSLLQWAAIAEVTGVSLNELTTRFKSQ